MTEFKQYRRKSNAELRPYIEGETLSKRVSISPADIENGSPKTGDMIARNPKDHSDMWLISEDYFIDNFEDNNDDEIYLTAIAHYGEPAQVLKAIEEMAELSIELSGHLQTLEYDDAFKLHDIEEMLFSIVDKTKKAQFNKICFRKAIEDNDKIRYECADVENMLNQLRIMFGTWDAEKKMKNERLMERIKNEQANNG